MERHVTLLGLLETLWGVLALLVGTAMLLLAAGAFTESVDPSAAALSLAAWLTAGVFGMVGLFALLWGGMHVWAASLLRRRRPFGRMLSLGLAIVNLVLLPFGTALGAYALWVLLDDHGRRLFEPARS